MVERVHFCIKLLFIGDTFQFSSAYAGQNRDGMGYPGNKILRSFFHNNNFDFNGCLHLSVKKEGSWRGVLQDYIPEFLWNCASVNIRYSHYTNC